VLPVQFLASEPHFADHIAPLWHALPDEYRGDFWAGYNTATLDRTVGVLRRHHRIPARVGWPAADLAGLCVVSAIGDFSLAHRSCPGLGFVFMEHGCGITYAGGSNGDAITSSYIGSKSRQGAKLIVTPNDFTAQIQQEATPNIPVFDLGTELRLDRWVGTPPPEPTDPPTVAISFHYDWDKLPETTSALPFYEHVLPVLAERFHVLGHAHPRLWPTASFLYEQAGIEPVRHFDEVLARAQLYAVDNSSTLYEFAATDRPVVVLNSPKYRRDVHHGLRFWDHIPGLEVDNPDELAAVIDLALTDPEHARQRRHDAVDVVFPQNDGGAAERLAAAVMALADEYRTPLEEVPAGYFVLDAAGGRIGHEATAYEAGELARRRGGTIVPAF
jgi:hypothetical protein